ncbi:MAG: hypothetical protein OXU34_07295 [Gammaproteobacteria bacterium]|nr:hypothetical protein [Gammaproteobacteria bacterium]
MKFPNYRERLRKREFCLFFGVSRALSGRYRGIAEDLRRRGYTLLRFAGKPYFLPVLLRHAKHVFFQPPCEGYLESIRAWCIEHKLPATYLEVGHFPQKDTIVMDRMGVNAESELMRGSLDFVDERIMQNYRRFVREWRANHRCATPSPEESGYIFCPLQLEDDRNIAKHSPYQSMQDFIRHVENKFPDDTVFFKRHPKDANPEGCYAISPKSRMVAGDPLMWAKNAKLVYGINSTVLLEAHLLGTPVEAVGDGFLRHPEKEKVLAALVDKQMPRTAADYGYWLSRYSDFHRHDNPLGKWKYCFIRILYAPLSLPLTTRLARKCRVALSVLRRKRARKGA